MRWAPPQRNREELLDAGTATRQEVHQSLRDLRRINLWLGNTQLVVHATIALLKKHRLQRATILDVGTGSADLPAALVRAASIHEIELQVLALDCKPLHLHTASEELSNEEHHVRDKVLLLGGDAFRLPLCDAGVDVVVSSLFLHHFRPPHIEVLLNEFSRVARLGWVMNDLVRHYVPLLFFKAAWPLFARSYLTRHDGAASFRRAYTAEEMRSHLHAMKLNVARIEVGAPFFRVRIIAEK